MADSGGRNHRQVTANGGSKGQGPGPAADTQTNAWGDRDVSESTKANGSPSRTKDDDDSDDDHDRESITRLRQNHSTSRMQRLGTSARDVDVLLQRARLGDVSVDACIACASALEEDGDTETAVAVWRVVAATGNGRAHAWLHRYYMEKAEEAKDSNDGQGSVGLGVGLLLERREEMLSLAQSHLLDGAKSGESKCQFELGRTHAQQQSFEEACVWWHRAAVRGNAQAMAALAICLQHGRGLNKNERAAYRWYKQSAERGHLPSMVRLAALCRTGAEGVSVNLSEAQRWERIAEQLSGDNTRAHRATDSGHSDGDISLGVSGHHGDNIASHGVADVDACAADSESVTVSSGQGDSTTTVARTGSGRISGVDGGQECEPVPLAGHVDGLGDNEAARGRSERARLSMLPSPAKLQHTPQHTPQKVRSAQSPVALSAEVTKGEETKPTEREGDGINPKSVQPGHAQLGAASATAVTSGDARPRGHRRNFSPLCVSKVVSVMGANKVELAKKVDTLKRACQTKGFTISKITISTGRHGHVGTAAATGTGSTTTAVPMTCRVTLLIPTVATPRTHAKQQGGCTQLEALATDQQISHGGSGRDRSHSSSSHGSSRSTVPSTTVTVNDAAAGGNRSHRNSVVADTSQCHVNRDGSMSARRSVQSTRAEVPPLPLLSSPSARGAVSPSVGRGTRDTFHHTDASTSSPLDHPSCTPTHTAAGSHSSMAFTPTHTHTDITHTSESYLTPRSDVLSALENSAGDLEDFTAASRTPPFLTWSELDSDDDLLSDGGGDGDGEDHGL